LHQKAWLNLARFGPEICGLLPGLARTLTPFLLKLRRDKNVNYRKRLPRILIALFVATLALSVGTPARPAAASGNYYWDFDSPDMGNWTAKGDPWVTGEVLQILSTDNDCPTNGTHYDDLNQGISPDPTARVWMKKSFPGDGLDTVVVDWHVRDEGAICNDYNPCEVGYYIGPTEPTSRGQFVPKDYIHDLGAQWYTETAKLNIVNQGTIWVALSWHHIRGESDDPSYSLGFDCINVNISTISPPGP
jgi:hypothetical protein